MEEITLNAYAKINISLQVTGRRPDGYHNIRSIMQGIDLCDEIFLTKCLKNGTKYNLPHCTIDGVVVYLCTDTKTIPVDMSNLAFKGIKAVLDEYSGVEESVGTSETGCEDGLESRQKVDFDELLVRIDKRLPVAAGIAGGSGNAAACMLGMNALLGYPFSMRELMETGAGVGADVPFSLMMNARRNAVTLADLGGLEEASTAARVSGIGDGVEPAAPMSRHIVMANPGISVSTREAYEAIDAIMCGQPAEDSAEWPLYVNDLEEYTLKEYPEAAELKDTMVRELGADMVMMSGSGPTMIAYYTDPGRAKEGFGRMEQLAEQHTGWRTWLTVTGIE